MPDPGFGTPDPGFPDSRFEDRGLGMRDAPVTFRPPRTLIGQCPRRCSGRRPNRGGVSRPMRVIKAASAAYLACFALALSGIAPASRAVVKAASADDSNAPTKLGQ